MSHDCTAEPPGFQYNFVLIANFVHSNRDHGRTLCKAGVRPDEVIMPLIESDNDLGISAAHDQPQNRRLKQPTERNVQAIVALEACMLVKIVGNVIASITVGSIFVINDEQFPCN